MSCATMIYVPKFMMISIWILLNLCQWPICDELHSVRKQGCEFRCKCVLMIFLSMRPSMAISAVDLRAAAIFALQIRTASNTKVPVEDISYGTINRWSETVAFCCYGRYLDYLSLIRRIAGPISKYTPSPPPSDGRDTGTISLMRLVGIRIIPPSIRSAYPHEPLVYAINTIHEGPRRYASKETQCSIRRMGRC
ncbi:hypothetical protein GGS21DRAFT_300688 [Xylaria nigripes]|nr:hypothetical protein GGS21DRAFT_300688 [Xylaria nigripes]